MPLLVTAFALGAGLIPLVAVPSLALCVTFWGGLAMAVTAGIGWLFGAVV